MKFDCYPLFLKSKLYLDAKKNPGSIPSGHAAKPAETVTVFSSKQQTESVTVLPTAEAAKPETKVCLCHYSDTC